MADPKFDELAADLDDASTAVEELQIDHDADAGEKLDDVRKTLEHASESAGTLTSFVNRCRSHEQAIVGAGQKVLHHERPEHRGAYRRWHPK